MRRGRASLGVGSAVFVFSALVMLGALASDIGFHLVVGTGLLAVLTVVAIHAAYRPSRFATALAVATGVLMTLWIGVLVLIDLDYRDADGFTDCWPDCSTVQDMAGYVFWWGARCSSSSRCLLYPA